MPVRFSTRCPNSDYLGFDASPEAIIAAAKKAEAVGFDAVFVNDHIIVGDDARSAPWTNVYDPFVAMSFIAAHTTRIRVGVSVLIMPYRNPITTAKSLATIDRMSGGRLIAGVGVGWNESEVVDRVAEVAKARGIPRAQVALAWLLSKPVITAPIVGATKLHHLDDAIASVAVKLTAEEILVLEEPYVPHAVVGFV